MFDKIAAVCLTVKNFEASLDFYKNVLELPTDYIDQKGKFANFKVGETSLAIFQKDKATGMFPAKYMKPAGGFLMSYQAKDLKTECKKLEAKGVKIFEGPKETSWGQKVAYFQDPDGNIWEVSEPFQE